MKSIFVTLLSGFMIYAGYIYHPIIHRAGNNIYEKFQTEFVPVEERTNVTATRTKITPPPVTPPPENSDSKDMAEDRQPVKKENKKTDKDSEKINPPQTVVSSTADSDVGKKVTQRNPIPHYPPMPGQDTTFKPKHKPPLPPRFDLLASIKRGLDVSNPANYFISERDRKLGEEILALENELNRRYQNRGLTLEQIKQLKADYDNAFSELAKKYGLNSQQLVKFQGLIRNKL